MWSTIANQETDPHFDVVGGWRKTADLTLAHLGQVQKYRDNLASVWPPSKSAAAAEYITRLDKLIVDLQATHDAAAANYTAFSTVTLTLSLARNKLKPILEQYEANEQLNLDWRAKQDAVVAKSAATGLTPAFRPPPVSTARQEQLNIQARAIMYDLSSTVISGQAALKKPQPYRPDEDARRGPDSEKTNTDAGSGFAAPPIIPAPGASSGGGFASSGGGFASAHSPASHSTVTPIQPTPQAPVNPGSAGVAPGGGPALSSLGTSPVITPPTSGPPPAPGPSPLPPPAPPGLIPGMTTPTSGGGLTPPGGLLPNGVKVPPGGSVKPGMGTGPMGRMTMPSGGVIGATPGSGIIGQMPAGSPGAPPKGPMRANPVGGVIGQQSGGSPNSGGTGPGQRARHPATPFGNQSARGRNQREDTAESARWDPDNPWTTQEGVDPVVLPPADQGPIDPGPAIGYSR
jgi:hypothetical protein